MSNRFYLAAAVAAFRMLPSLSAFAQETKSKLDEVLARGHLVLGTGSTNAPWHFKSADDKLQGFDVDMGHIIAKALFNDPGEDRIRQSIFRCAYSEHHHGQGRYHLPVHDRDR